MVIIIIYLIEYSLIAWLHLPLPVIAHPQAAMLRESSVTSGVSSHLWSLYPLPYA